MTLILSKLAMAIAWAVHQAANNALHLRCVIYALSDTLVPPITHVDHAYKDAINVLSIQPMEKFVQIVRPYIIFKMGSANLARLHASNVAHKLPVYHASMLTSFKLIVILASTVGMDAKYAPMIPLVPHASLNIFLVAHHARLALPDA